MKKTFFQKLENMPVAILPTMVGAATLSNVYLTLGYTWIRHITMIAAAIILTVYLIKIFGHNKTVLKEYSNTVPASLYAGLTMITMILGSYVFDYNAVIGKGIWFTGLILHAIHIIVFTYRNVIKGVNIDTFVPSWFVTYNGIMVSTVVGGVMKEPVISKTETLPWQVMAEQEKQLLLKQHYIIRELLSGWAGAMKAIPLLTLTLKKYAVG